MKKYRDHCMVSSISYFSILSYLLIDILILKLILAFIRYRKNMDGFVSVKSKNLFSRLNIDRSFLQESISSWEQNATFVEAKKKVFSLKAVNDTAETAVKLVQNFHGKIIAKEEQKFYTVFKNTENCTLIAKMRL